MNSRPLPALLPFVFLAASVSVTAAQAQTLPTLTYALTGSGTTMILGQATDYRNYTFNITGFSNVGPDPSSAYTIFSLSNSTIESSPDFYGLLAPSLPPGWTFTDTSDFIISTDPLGIHAFDPMFGLTILQKAGTPAIDPNGAPVELFHQINGVNPFTDGNGTPITIPAQAVPEASSIASFGLLLLGGLTWGMKRSARQRV